MASLEFMGITMPDARYCLVRVGSRGLFAAVDEADWERVRYLRWSEQRSGELIYATTSLARGTVGMHRFLTDMRDPAVYVDHRDGCGLNNRQYNLRPSTPTQNAMNRAGAHDSVSGVRGVTWIEERRLWRVKGVDGVARYFRDLTDAVKERNEIHREKYGEFARLV